jgi:hypothetical protein
MAYFSICSPWRFRHLLRCVTIIWMASAPNSGHGEQNQCVTASWTSQSAYNLLPPRCFFTGRKTWQSLEANTSHSLRAHQITFTFSVLWKSIFPFTDSKRCSSARNCLQQFHSQSLEFCTEVIHSLITHGEKCLNLWGDKCGRVGHCSVFL